MFFVKVSRFGSFVGAFGGVFRFAFCVYDRELASGLTRVFMLLHEHFPRISTEHFVILL